MKVADGIDFKITRASSELERLADWRGWIRKIPYVAFPDGWETKVIPPFGGCLARYLIRVDGAPNEVSVYLDGYGTMDTWKEPHYEVYPTGDGDVSRCAMDDTGQLVQLIFGGLYYRGE